MRAASSSCRAYSGLLLVMAGRHDAGACGAGPAAPQVDMSWPTSGNPDDDNGPPISLFANLLRTESWVAASRVRADGLVLNRKTLELTWKLSYSNLTSTREGVRHHGHRLRAARRVC